MARWKWCACLAWMAILPLASFGQVREWSDVSGNRVRGEMTARQGESITLRLEEGGTLVIPMDNLAEADRRIAFAWRPKHGNSKVVFGDPWTVASIGLEMVWIPPGNFLRGSSVLEQGRTDDEALREVVVSRGFWLGKFELTQAQWAALMRTSPSEIEGEGLPVEHVSWNMATAFCRKVTERERAKGTLPQGYVYSLPSEAQWEYACRAGTRTSFCHGNEAGGLDKYAWTLENAEEKTHPVGKLRPNRWGLHDMHGNVLEWCRDLYGEYPRGKTINPTGPGFGKKRVARGGSVINPQIDCRSAKRYSGAPDEEDMVGLRLALTPIWR